MLLKYFLKAFQMVFKKINILDKNLPHRRGFPIERFLWNP
jgi:hypothetical protein